VHSSVGAARRITPIVGEGFTVKSTAAIAKKR